MTSGQNQHDAGHYPHEADLPAAAGGVHHGPRTLPAMLNSPELLAAWRTRALIVCAVATVLSLPFLFVYGGKTHMLRAYLLGFMLTFSFAGGGLALLMLQYVSGGKWGMLIRRPLEAMSRTLWLVAALFIPIGLLARHLYQWAVYVTPQEELQAASARRDHQGTGAHRERQAHDVLPDRLHHPDHHHLQRADPDHEPAEQVVA